MTLRDCNLAGLLLASVSSFLGTVAHAEMPTNRAQKQPETAETKRDVVDETFSFDAGPTKGLIVRSPLGESEVEFHMAAWFQWKLEPLTDEPMAFAVALARPAIQGRFFNRRLYVFAQLELAGKSGPRLLDWFLDAKLLSSLELRIGQFRTPFSRSFVGPIIKLQFSDRGKVVNAFHLNRDTGIMLHGVLAEKFEYSLGVFNGAPINTLADLNTLPMPVARIVYNLGASVPYDQVPTASAPRAFGLAFGGSAAVRRQDVALGEETTTVDLLTGGLDIATLWGPANATAEGFYRFSRFDSALNEQAFGATVQGGLFVLPQFLEAAVRGGWMYTHGLGFQQSYEIGFNAYFSFQELSLGHHLKTTAQYRFTTSELFAANAAEHEIIVQTQMWF